MMKKMNWKISYVLIFIIILCFSLSLSPPLSLCVRVCVCVQITFQTTSIHNGGYNHLIPIGRSMTQQEEKNDVRSSSPFLSFPFFSSKLNPNKFHTIAIAIIILINPNPTGRRGFRGLGRFRRCTLYPRRRR